jgi:hypothetical protein
MKQEDIQKQIETLQGMLQQMTKPKEEPKEELNFPEYKGATEEELSEQDIMLNLKLDYLRLEDVEMQLSDKKGKKITEDSKFMHGRPKTMNEVVSEALVLKARIESYLGELSKIGRNTDKILKDLKNINQDYKTITQ